MSNSPEQAIREWLADPNLKGPQGRPLPFHVLPETVRFVKHREGGDRQLWYVTCDAEGAQRVREHSHWIVLATGHESGRWDAQGVAGGGGVAERSPPGRGHPYANLGGNWGRQGFRAGGTVADAGSGVALVRLTDRAGRSFEDTVDDGVVLFMSGDTVAMPMRVDLLDATGGVIGTDQWGFLDE